MKEPKAGSESGLTSTIVSITMQIRVTLLARDPVCPNQNQEKPPRSHFKVKGPSSEGLADLHTSINGDQDKSVDLHSPNRSWVWFPSIHELKTHYVRVYIVCDYFETCFLY